MPTAPSNPAIIDDEDEELTTLPPAVRPMARAIPAPTNTGVAAPAPKPAEIGSTGGMVTTQAEFGGAPQPTRPERYSQDAGERETQARQAVDANFRKQQERDRPFAPSGELAKPGSLPEGMYRAGAAMADEEAMNDRRAEIARRRQANAQAVDQRRTKNAQLEAEMRGTGQKFYTDEFQQIQPVIEAGTGRPLYDKTDWEDGGMHPETGEPTLIKRDQYGQRQYKAPQLTVGPDPQDDQLYYKFGDNDLRPAGSMISLAGHPNPKIARMALGANKRRIEAMHREALAGVKAISDGAKLEIDTAKANITEVQGRIEELMQQSTLLDEAANATAGLMAGPTPGALQAQSQQAANGAEAERLTALLDTMKLEIQPGGRLGRTAAAAQKVLKIATATSVRDTFAAQEAETLKRLEDEGGDPATDRFYLENKRNLENAEIILQAANREQERFDAVFNKAVTPPEPAATPPEPTSGFFGDLAKRAGRSMVKMPGQLVEGAGMLLDAVGRGAAVMGAVEDATANRVSQDAIQGNVARAVTTPTPGADEVAATGRQMSADAGAGYEQPGLTPDPLRNDQLFAQAADSVGSLAGAMIVPGGLIAKTAAGAIINSQGQAAEARQTMTARGETPEAADTEALNQFVLNLPAGALESIPWANVLKRFGGANMANAISQKYGKSALARITGALFGQAALEGGEEMLQQLWGNAAAIAGYDPGRSLGEGVGKAGAVGAVMGGGLGGATQTAAELANRKPGITPQDGGGNPMVPPGGALPPSNDTGIPGTDRPASPITGRPLTPDEQAAEAELQRKLAEDESGVHPIFGLVRNLTGEKSAKDAIDSARVFEPGFFADTDAAPADEQSRTIRDPNNPSQELEVPVRREEPAAGEPGHLKGLPVDNPAADSAVAFQQGAADERAAAVSEEGAQALVDELQEVSGLSREEILATRAGKETAQWAEELQNEIEYKRSPLTVNPERRSTELRAELEKLDREWEVHLQRTGVEAELAAQTQAVRERAGQIFQADTTAARDRHELLTARREAIETGLQELERSRQSAAGAEGLRNELSTEADGAEQRSRRIPPVPEGLRNQLEPREQAELDNSTDGPFARRPDLEARRDAIEEQLTDAERLRQSERGGVLLDQDLATQEATTARDARSPNEAQKSPGPAVQGNERPPQSVPERRSGEADGSAPAEVAVEFDDTPSPESRPADITPSVPEVAAAPADPATTTPADVAKMKPDAFVKFYQDVNASGSDRSMTGDAHAFGREHTTPAQIEDLKQMRDHARELTRIAMEKRSDDAMNLSFVSQFYAEAYDIASQTGTFDAARDVEQKMKAIAAAPAAPAAETPAPAQKQGSTAEELKGKIAFLEAARKSEASKPRRTPAIQQKQIGINNDYLNRIDALKAELSALEKPAAATLAQTAAEIGSEETVKQGDIVTVKMPDGRKYPKTRVTKIVDTPEGRRYQVDVFGEKFVKRAQIETKAELEAADKAFDRRVEEGFSKSATAKETPAEKAEPGDKSKRAKDFATSGNYELKVGGKIRRFFRDPENKWWYEDAPGHHSQNVLSTGTKAEAIASLETKYGGAPAPQTAAEKFEEVKKRFRAREATPAEYDAALREKAKEQFAPAAAAAEKAGAEPVVTPTEGGQEISATPATDSAVSKMADRPQLKAQKDFLLKALDAAEKAAPDELPVTPKGAEMMAVVDAAHKSFLDPDEAKRTAGNEAIQKLAVAAGLDKYERARKPGDIADTLRYQITRDHAEHVTIDVPGDGQFRVPNTKEALKAFRARVNSRMNKTTADLPSPFSDEVKPYVAQKPTGIPTIKKNPTKDDLTEAAAIAQSSDEERVVINRVYTEDGFSIGTDGRRLFIVAGGGGDTAADIAKLKIKVGGSDEPGKFPNWRQVIPKWIKLDGGKVRADKDAPEKRAIVDTGEAIKALNQVIAVLDKDAARPQAVRLYLLGGGKLGFSASNPKLGDYSSEGVTDEMMDDAANATTAADPAFLRDAMAAARLAGHERVTMYFDDARSPMVVIGGNNFAGVTMPISMEGPGRTAATLPPKPKPSGIAYQPGFGPDAKPAAAAEPTQVEKNRAAFEADKARRGTPSNEETKSGAAAPTVATGPGVVRSGNGTAAQVDPTPPAREDLEGEKINRSWTAFGPDSKSLGIPRAEMPQIKSEHRGALVQFLAARGITAKATMADPAALRPTQAEFSPAKVQAAREFRGSERPILVSQDGHVVDGHHQWVASLDDPSPMPVIRLNGPIDKVLAEMKEFPSVENAAGAAPAAAAPKSPAATIPLSDRVIKALQDAKISKPGRVLSGDPVSLAWDAALEIAILAVRAGRKASEVISMSVQRYKAKHPKHTPADITKLEARVREIVERSTPPPDEDSKRKNSLFPESVKTAGGPAKSIPYDTRSHDARRDEAAAILRREGRAAGERLLQDQSIPRDTRIAIGGNLIGERMLSLAGAAAADVQKITREIRRTVAIMQPELATESGQAVSMFGGIYKDLRVAAAIDYIRHADRERADKVGGTDAADAADAAVKAVRGKSKTEAEKAIEALKKKYSTKPAEKVLDVFKKRIDKILELDRIGALERDDMIDIASAELGIKGADAGKLKQIAELAEKVNKAKTHSERSRAELDLMSSVEIHKGTKGMDVLSSLLVMNVLSGYTTQTANIHGNFLMSLGQMATTAAVNPGNVGALFDGWSQGLPLGFSEAGSILKTGRSTRDFQDKTGGASNVLERVDFTRDFNIPEFLGLPMTKGARAVAYVGRFMKAMDAVFYYPAREAYARLAATKLLEGKYQGAELAKKVDETLHVTPAAFEAARKQAEAEGYNGIDLGRRTADIIEENRKSTDDGRIAVAQSEQFAAESTFTNEPVGLAGVAYHALKYAVEEGRLAGVPVLKPWLMFLKTPTNVFNELGNWTILGAIRAHTGMRGAGMHKTEKRNFTKDERNRMFVKAAVGSILMAAIALGMDSEDMDVSATGPTDSGKRRQLEAAGWSPFSFRVGNRRISYKDSPLLIPMAIMGYVSDSRRYQKTKSDLLLGNQILDAMLKSPQVIFETSMLSGLGQLMTAARDGDMRGIGRTLSSIPANLLIPYNRLLQQIDQSFDTQSYDAPPVVGALPFARRAGRPLLDVQGRPQRYHPTRRFTTEERNDPVDSMLRAKNVFIPEPGRDTKLGNAVMTEEQYNKYRDISGKRIRARLQFMAPRLRVLTQEKAQDEISRVSAEERTKAKTLIRSSGR